MAPDVIDLAGPRIRITPVTGMPLLHITEPRIGGAGQWLKPVYERVLAVPLLVLASPLLVAAAVAIVVDSGRPIFYRQRRIGFGGREFEMLKFRTMVRGQTPCCPICAPPTRSTGPCSRSGTIPGSPGWAGSCGSSRSTSCPSCAPWCRARWSSWGPRPCLPQETQGFGEAARRRFLARPGVTGLWQVSGRSDVSWDEAVRLDLYYVENWSPFLDLTILYRTLGVVFGGRGGY